MSDEKVMIDSPEAATFKTVEGWVSRDGRFFGKGDGAERAARWSGATHQYCSNCKTVIKKGWLLCEDCREKRAVEKFEQAPRKKWDGETPIYSDALDEFVFGSPGEALETAMLYADETDPIPTLESLRLYLCEPQYARQIELDDFTGQLPEDWVDGPGWLEKAITQFNEAIAGQPPLSWVPGKYALDVSSE